MNPCRRCCRTIFKKNIHSYNLIYLPIPKEAVPKRDTASLGMGIRDYRLGVYQWVSLRSATVRGLRFIWRQVYQM